MQLWLNRGMDSQVHPCERAVYAHWTPVKLDEKLLHDFDRIIFPFAHDSTTCRSRYPAMIAGSIVDSVPDQNGSHRRLCLMMLE